MSTMTVCYFDGISIKQRVGKIVGQWLLAQCGGTRDSDRRREEIETRGWCLRRRVVDGGMDVLPMWGAVLSDGKTCTIAPVEESGTPRIAVGLKFARR